MSRAVEAACGAQVLPQVGHLVGHERKTITGWEAHCACGADERARRPELQEVAGRLVVVPDESKGN